MVLAGPEQSYYTLNQLAKWYREFWYDLDLRVRSKGNSARHTLEDLITEIPELQKYFERPSPSEYLSQGGIGNSGW